MLTNQEQKKKLHTLVIGGWGAGNRKEKAALLLRYLEYQLW